MTYFKKDDIRLMVRKIKERMSEYKNRPESIYILVVKILVNGVNTKDIIMGVYNSYARANEVGEDFYHKNVSCIQYDIHNYILDEDNEYQSNYCLEHSDFEDSENSEDSEEF